LITAQITAVLLLILAATLFMTERLRVDVVALLGLDALALTGLVAGLKPVVIEIAWQTGQPPFKTADTAGL
jgi:hypothetical protein